MSACENISSNEEVVVEENLGESVMDDWSTFESPVVGIRFQYPSELEWSLRETDLQGFDKGYRRRYSFSGTVDGTVVSFSLDATTADFGFGISEGCCWAFGGPTVDLSKSDEEIKNDLGRGVESISSKEDPGNWKLLEVYGLERLALGSRDVIRFADLTGFIGYFLGDNYLIPYPNHEFTNIIVSWRGSEMFTNLEGELSYEEFFAQIEDFADGWMDELTGSEEKEKALIEKILSTLEFVEFAEGDYVYSPDTLEDGPSNIVYFEEFPFSMEMPTYSNLTVGEDKYTIWLNQDHSNSLVFDRSVKSGVFSDFALEDAVVYETLFPLLETYCHGTDCVILFEEKSEYYNFVVESDDEMSDSEKKQMEKIIGSIQPY